MPDQPQFLFMTCQVGAEPTLKLEMARYRPNFRFAYSRPGFLTFKLPEKHHLAEDFELHSVFARAYGFSLGKIAVDEDPAAAVAEVWHLAGDRQFKALHVWPRDRLAPGERGYEVGQTDEARAVEIMLRAAAPSKFNSLKTKRLTQPGELVLDVVVIDRKLWWVGYHRAGSPAARRPGGFYDDIELPYEAVSRAYLKMEEALRWSKLPVRKGDHAAEIGCAPGGSCQALLKRGLLVTGIDPAEMHPAVLDHPNFRHLQMRGDDVKRREFRDVRWLMTDMNVTPTYTLDTVEGIVTHREVNIEGLLLTLKLLSWEYAEHIPEFIARVQSWGYGHVQCTQLQHNRREFCLAAMRGDGVPTVAPLQERAEEKLKRLVKRKTAPKPAPAAKHGKEKNRTAGVKPAARPKRKVRKPRGE